MILDGKFHEPFYRMSLSNVPKIKKYKIIKSQYITDN